MHFGSQKCSKLMNWRNLTHGTCPEPTVLELGRYVTLIVVSRAGNDSQDKHRLDSKLKTELFPYIMSSNFTKASRNFCNPEFKVVAPLACLLLIRTNAFDTSDDDCPRDTSGAKSASFKTSPRERNVNSAKIWDVSKEDDDSPIHCFTWCIKNNI